MVGGPICTVIPSDAFLPAARPLAQPLIPFHSPCGCSGSVSTSSPPIDVTHPTSGWVGSAFHLASFGRLLVRFCRILYAPQGSWMLELRVIALWATELSSYSAVVIVLDGVPLRWMHHCFGQNGVTPLYHTIWHKNASTPLAALFLICSHTWNTCHNLSICSHTLGHESC